MADGDSNELAVDSIPLVVVPQVEDDSLLAPELVPIPFLPEPEKEVKESNQTNKTEDVKRASNGTKIDEKPSNKDEISEKEMNKIISQISELQNQMDYPGKNGIGQMLTNKRGCRSSGIPLKSTLPSQILIRYPFRFLRTSCFKTLPFFLIPFLELVVEESLEAPLSNEEQKQLNQYVTAVLNDQEPNIRELQPQQMRKLFSFVETIQNALDDEQRNR